MAGSRKKRNVEQNSESNDSENMEIDTVLEADFEGRNPSDSDFHGIQQLLKQLFLKAHVNLSELCNLIIVQQGIGSVLKQSYGDDDDDDDDDNHLSGVFGITTVVNLHTNKDNECVKQIFNSLKSLANEYAEKSVVEKLESILSDNKKIGLIINERFINIPAKVADPLLDSLQSELNTFGKRNSNYIFDYFVMICKTYKYLNNDSTVEEKMFINAEEEIFANSSEISFEFNVANEADFGVGGLWTEDDKQMTPLRRVLLINGKKLPEIVQNIKNFVM